MDQEVECEEVFDNVSLLNRITHDYDEDTDEINTKAILLIVDGEDENLGEMHYNMKRDCKSRYTYSVAFKFNDYYISEDMEEFMEIKDAINKCSDNLYNNMCRYLHDYTMDGFDYGENEYNGLTVPYNDRYYPSKIRRRNKYVVNWSKRRKCMVGFKMAFNI